MAPWQGPRHRSWASNTNASTVALAILFGTWLIWEIVGEAPPALSSLLGPVAGIWFGAVAQDQKKRQEEAIKKAEEKQAELDAKLKQAEEEKPDE